MKKKLLVYSIIAICTIFLFTSDVQAQSLHFDHTISNDSMPRAAIIDWRYQSIDGKIYRRLYNYTYQRWEGDWELCP